jgi:hypothetical protein
MGIGTLRRYHEGGEYGPPIEAVVVLAPVVEEPLPPPPPFNILDVPVKELADYLATVDSADQVRELMGGDDRESALRHYERRLEELEP